MTWSRLARAAMRTALAAAVGSGTLVAWQARPDVEASASISGTIKSAADDAPVARARVSAAAGSNDPHVALTGADGKYTLTDLPAGVYAISVTRTGYAPQTYGRGRQLAGAPVTVANGQHVANVDLWLAPSHSIAGRILDEDGTPFAGAVVEALVPRTEAGKETLTIVAQTESDDRGEFRLHGLAQGQYYVSASDPAFRSVATAKGVQRYSPTYYPGVSFADQAKPVSAAANEPPRIEFRLKLVPPARVSGQLVVEEGRELLNGAMVMNGRDSEGLPAPAPEDLLLMPDGRFRFGQVFPGRYLIRARAQTGASSPALFALYAVDVLGKDIENIRMELRPGAQLDGRVSFEAARGSRPPLPSSLRVRAPFTDGNSFGDSLTGAVQPDGSFAVRGLMRGAHQIVVDGLQSPWVVKSISYRGSDITDRAIEVSDREQFRDIQITLTDASSVVNGTVENSRHLPEPHVAVLVFPRVPLFWTRTNRRLRVAYTDETGRFTIPGLPAGDYLAVASMTIDEGDLGRRARLEQLQALATTFRLERDDAQTSVTLSLLR